MTRDLLSPFHFQVNFKQGFVFSTLQMEKCIEEKKRGPDYNEASLISVTRSSPQPKPSISQATLPKIRMVSSSLNAFKVVTRMFPSAILLSVKVA